jgi:GNAT superfamily N-acetyltransferase
MAVVVRRATKSDAGKIAEFSVALAEQHYGYDPIRFTRLITKDGAEAFYGGRVEAESAALFVAEIDDRVIGFAYMEYEPTLYAELATKVGWLHDIYVEPDAQGSGAGKALIEAVKDEAKRQGANKVLISVSVMNKNGRKFFEHNGFRTTMHEMMLAIEKE